MKNLYALNRFRKNFHKSIMAASFVGAFASMNLNAQTSYCASAAANSNDDEIFNVTFGTLNHTSACGATTGGPGSIQQEYSNFTAPTVAAVNVTQGLNYSFSVTVGQCNGNVYGGYVGAWIDFNQNGSFTDPGENVFMAANSTQWAVAGTIITSTAGITIPMTAMTGVTRMRVIAEESSMPSPCGTNYPYGYGETENYSVNIQLAPGCTGTPPSSSVTGAGPLPACAAGTTVSLTQTPTNLTSGSVLLLAICQQLRGSLY